MGSSCPQLLQLTLEAGGECVGKALLHVGVEGTCGSPAKLKNWGWGCCLARLLLWFMNGHVLHAKGCTVLICPQKRGCPCHSAAFDS